MCNFGIHAIITILTVALKHNLSRQSGELRDYKDKVLRLQNELIKVGESFSSNDCQVLTVSRDVADECIESKHI